MRDEPESPHDWSHRAIRAPVSSVIQSYMGDSRGRYVLYEYACHEGNYALRNILSAARAAER